MARASTQTTKAPGLMVDFVDESRTSLYRMMNRGYRSLFQQAQREGHWDEVRATALAGIALELREDLDSPWPLKIKQWLEERHDEEAETTRGFADKTDEMGNPISRKEARKAAKEAASKAPASSSSSQAQSCEEWLCPLYRSENHTGLWGDEVWDSSMALLCLYRIGQSTSAPVARCVVAGLLRLYDKGGRHSWHDDPWETSWALMAILEAQLIGSETEEKILADTQNKIHRICLEATDWLIGLANGEGRVISPHQTAYLVYITGILLRRGDGLEAAQRHRLMNAREGGIRYLFSPAAFNEDVLWEGEAWANGQILWMLGAARALPVEDVKWISHILFWFQRQQGLKGNWSDVEDTASAILGLGALLHELERPRLQHEVAIKNEIRVNLRRMMATPRLYLRRSLVIVQEDGTITINLGKRFLATILGVGAVLGLISQYWDFLAHVFGW